MANIAVLNNVDHADLKVIARPALEFGENVNQVALFPTEFAEAQKDFPILLHRFDNGDVTAVALLGLGKDENLFISEGQWRAHYRPALLKRGPFSIGRAGEGDVSDLKVLIDLDHPRISKDEGHALFKAHGGATAFLEDIQATLQKMFEGEQQRQPMVEAFEAAGILAPVDVDIQLNDHSSAKISGYFTVSAAAFNALDSEKLGALHRSGFMAHAIYMMASLSNIHRLVDMKNFQMKQSEG